MAGKGASEFYKPVAYGLLNIVSASGIVFANKAVMTTFGFHFIYALTLIHTITTLVGMKVFAYMGLYEAKKLPKISIAPLAGAYVGYIVLNNLNLQLNTVGFYQISKIAVAPAVSIPSSSCGRAEDTMYISKLSMCLSVILFRSAGIYRTLQPLHTVIGSCRVALCIAQVLLAEAVFFGKRASRKVVAAIVVVCMGVGLSTVTDTQVLPSKSASCRNQRGWSKLDDEEKVAHMLMRQDHSRG